MTEKSPTHKVMGDILKAIRLQRSRTLQDVERDLNVYTSGLSRVERGLQGFPQDTLIGLLRYYGIDLPDLLIKAAGLSESDLDKARQRSKSQHEELANTDAVSVPAGDGWVEHNPVLASREYVGNQMLLCRRSFENTEFELIYLGRVMRSLGSIQAAKAAAPGFARMVLRDECQQIAL
jgi:transcriptional regulator with XRE-family HTH domain